MSGLSKDQYQEIAGKVLGTKRNVYHLAMRLFNHEWTDEDFDTMAAFTGIFHCEFCSEWKDKSEGIADIPGVCTLCVDGEAPDGDL